MNNNKSKLFLAVFVIIIAIVTCVVLGVDRNSDDNPSIPSQTDRDLVYYNGETYEYNHNVKNILFMGLDNNTEMQQENAPGGGAQADCILLITLDKEHNTTKVLQISRDSMTDVDIYDVNGNYYTTIRSQIATQYAYGNGAKNSCWAMKKTVSEFLYELPIDGYIALDIAAVSKINDMLGGVTITVPEDYTMVDPAFQKGVTLTLTGAQAEKYVRYRNINITGDNNFRMQRQVQYIPALFKTFQEKTRNSKDEIERLYTEIASYVTTDLSLDEMNNMSGYSWDAENVSYIEGEIVPGEEFEEFHVDDKKLKDMIMKMFYKLKQ